MNREEYDILISRAKEASEAYYNGKEIMSNKEFDDIVDQIRQFELDNNIVREDSPTINVGAKPVDSLPKFKHPYPALSLDKTKDISEFQKKFRDGIEASGDLDNDGVVLMWKLDGSTVQMYYRDCKLIHLVTRGNGEIGSDITHNASSISGVPLIIPVGGEVVVRGEALMSYKDFEDINSNLPEGEQFKNPRNLAAASISMLDPTEVAKRHVTVKAFNLVKYEPDSEDQFDINYASTKYSFAGRLNFLHRIGFNVVERVTCSVDELDKCIETMSSQVANYGYPVDGLVAALNNYNYASALEGTEHHPHILNGYAFKWSDETAETILREIEWSPSRTGLLNPVAIFDPVELEGTTVQRASVHNVSVLCSMNLHIGDRIEVFKSNKIIPQVYKNIDIDKHSPYSIHELHALVGDCPTCRTSSFINTSPEGIMTAECPNPDCPEKMIGKLAHFCERDCMDIQGMSEETIKKLVDAGFIKEYADFFKLDQKPGIAFLPGFGKQSWKKMCEAANVAKQTTFVKFITAIGIPNIGKGQAKTLYKYISENYDDICDKLNYSKEGYYPLDLFRRMCFFNFNFTTIDGFGTCTVEAMTQWVCTYLDCDSPEANVLGVLEFADMKPSKDTASKYSVITGKSFCITGKLIHFNNRQELVAKIELLGGKWIDSVSSKTDYLINNDVASTSGKNKKSKELNIPIISEEDFLKMIGE